MSGADISIYTEISLIICLVVFVGVIAYTLTKRNRELFAHAQSMPLADDAPIVPGASSSKEDSQ
jgi:cbb3-type cytochrome oxidase subunit 3